jgi:antitoxin component of MazEF toxin-antitoxin module
MSQEQTRVVAYSETLLPPKDILEMLDVAKDVGVEISIDDYILTLRPRKEIERAQASHEQAHINLDERREAVRRIDALRESLFQKYGEMPDSVELVREMRSRDD